MLKNGDWSKWIIRILIMFILTTAGSIMWFHETKISAIEKDSRDRDIEIKENHNADIIKQNEKIEKACVEQAETNKEVAVKLANIDINLEYIKKAIDKKNGS